MTMPEEPTSQPDQDAAPKKKDAGLELIAILKMVKGVLITGLAFGFFHAINQDLGETVRNWTVRLRIDPENHFIRLLLEKVTNINSRKFHTFGVISLIYASELYLEGLGLWFNQGWAKYMVVIATGIWIPEEGYATFQNFSWGRLSLLLINLAVLVYVVWVLCRKKKAPPAGKPQAEKSG